MPFPNTKEPPEISNHGVPQPSPANRVPLNQNQIRRLIGLAILAGLLSIAFLSPLADFVRFALAKERNSYLILIPFISLYLIWDQRKQTPLDFKSSLFPAVPLFVLALTALWASRGTANPTDHLSLLIFSYLCLSVTGAFLFVGSKTLRSIAFPVAFLLFAIPMPTSFVDAIEIFLQHTSAEASYWMITLCGVPIYRNGLEFQMPGIAVRVAQECSGYNSSFALFMVSALAGRLFLQSPWKRVVLTLAVIPLSIIRNGFRISTISLLCVKVDPAWIHSRLHHNGGPIFFTLSLIPFLLLLWLLRRSERAVKSADNLTPPAK